MYIYTYIKRKRERERERLALSPISLGKSKTLLTSKVLSSC
jgi:hypothetical protein